MHFADADKQIATLKKNYPKNACVHLLDGEKDFLKTFVTEEQGDFDNLIKNNDARLALLENENKNSPYYRYVIAELILHKAYSRIKFKQYVKAALEIRKAFKMLEENKVLFPEFKPTLKNLGMLHCVMASVPQNYKWIAGMAGLNGTLEGGIAEMNELLAHIVSKKEYDYMHNETLMWLIFIETHLNKQASKSLDLIKQYTNLYSSPITVFSVGNVYFHYQKNDELLALFDSYKDDGRTFPMIFLRYFRGVAYLQKLDQKGEKEFWFYINNYKGFNYKKGAYQRLAWLALLRNDDSAYQTLIAKCITEGNDLVDEDLVALSEAENNEKPNVILLRARLLFDGGYYSPALKELSGHTANTFPSFREKLEFIYRTARVFEMLNNEKKALELYEQTITLGKTYRYQYAANAAHSIGQIYEANKDFVNAEKYYKLCLSMRNHDYQNSMDQKAKAGLDRIKNKQ